MSGRTHTSRPPLSDWQVGMLRLTAFPSPAAEFSDQDWWTDVFGEPPESISSHPRTGEQHLEGPFGSGQIALDLQPMRIEWRYMAMDEPSGYNAFPVLGPFLENLGSFQRLMNHWLELKNCPPTIRLAFGATLLLPVLSHEAGYELLSLYLPSVRLDPQGSSDFSYQINRRRKSTIGIPDLDINRLSKWSVIFRRQSLVSMDFKSIREFPELYACRLDLDINTAPEFEGEIACDPR